MTGFLDTPSLNNSGEVAFYGSFDSGSGTMTVISK